MRNNWENDPDSNTFHMQFDMCPVVPFAIPRGDGGYDMDYTIYGQLQFDYGIEFNHTNINRNCKLEI